MLAQNYCAMLVPPKKVEPETCRKLAKTTLSSTVIYTLSGTVFPQQRKLTGSSAQISSGVCRCGSEEQVPDEGSRRFRRVPGCAGVGSGGRFRRVPVCAGVGSRGRFRKVPEGSGEFKCFGRLSRVSVWFVALQP